ncbi:ubiquitin carboxyl-terminal hydrolase 15-like [Amphibalanus amphitrite]|uniref:ubiquitin carboxyl-terminal hydrolase 15-like n=1 Tax=Amphibalanus amphitrite TaxID=1232801 RepID=UPI001C9160A9|nr:ubiquitin carboxyl-terminal hydrolase 15-like [Amphibalanus amphitrite]
MQDAHEFIILLLSWLHDDLNAVTTTGELPPRPPAEGLPNIKAGEAAWCDFQRYNSSIVTQLFHGLHKSTLLCTGCGSESVTFETFSLLSLPLAMGKSNLTQCLDEYLRGDLITDWTCPKCQCRCDVHKKLDLWWLPPIVILHLKRFSFAGGTARKNHAQVTFPLRDLDLSRLAVGSHPNTYRLVYDLYGVVEHHGSQDGGHYTAYSFNHPADSWFFMDDSKVRECSAASVRDATAYLLCYRARERHAPEGVFTGDDGAKSTAPAHGEWRTALAGSSTIRAPPPSRWRGGTANSAATRFDSAPTRTADLGHGGG